MKTLYLYGRAMIFQQRVVNNPYMGHQSPVMVILRNDATSRSAHSNIIADDSRAASHDNGAVVERT